jgi:aryl-alcohol dehydrogenase-like predicted oxidoreductase
MWAVSNLREKEGATMKYTYLGRTGLYVSRIALGLWQAGGDWGPVDEAAETVTIRRALDLGINFFDTAQAYGFGASERLLGAALRGKMSSERDKIVIATKGGLRQSGNGLVRDASPAWLRKGIEESLRALGTDHVDLYQVHWPDRKTTLAETADALSGFVREGKARYIGVSNFSAADLAEMGRYRRIDTLQPAYSLFRREFERDVLPYCREQGIGVLVYGPLAHGLLSGRMTENPKFPAGDWRSTSQIFRGDTLRTNLAVADRLRGLAERRGHSLVHLAIAWTLSVPGVHVAIVGSHSPEQISGAVGAVELEMAAADREEVETIMKNAVPLGGPSPEAMPAESAA